MGLSANQIAELDRLGPENVSLKLSYAGVGSGALVRGFSCEDMTRSDVEDWLANQGRKSAKQQADTLWWAKAATIVAVVSLIVTLIIAVVSAVAK
jgi:hypothetical protein